MAVIEFINAKNLTYVSMKKALNYIIKPDKTMEHLVGGLNCNPDTAYYEYILTKQKYKKETGRQFLHFTQSFSPEDKVTPEMAFEIAEKLLQHECFKGFQIKYATHIDKDHIHTHFVINSVNAGTGKKWQQSPQGLKSLKDYSDGLCRGYGLMVIDGEKKHKSRGEYRSEQKGISWKREIYLAVLWCKYHSVSREDFIKNLKQFGISVTWSDNRKYITFTNADGKVCRNRKLYPAENFTKEALLRQFQLNRDREDEKVLKSRLKLVLNAVKKLGEESNCDNAARFPLQYLEGQALEDEIEEWKKGKGLDWDIER